MICELFVKIKLKINFFEFNKNLTNNSFYLKIKLLLVSYKTH